MGGDFGLRTPRLVPFESDRNGGGGVRCVGGQIFRFSSTPASGTGGAAKLLDCANPPNPLGKIESNSTWDFQYWSRDPQVGGSGFILTDGLEVTC